MSAGEILLIFFVALMLFGSKSLPGFAKSLGRAYREFKRATEDIKQEIAQNADIAGIKREVDEIRENLSGSIANVQKSVVNEVNNTKAVLETSVTEKNEKSNSEPIEISNNSSADDYQHSVYKQAAEEQNQLSENEPSDAKTQDATSLPNNSVEVSAEKNTSI